MDTDSLEAILADLKRAQGSASPQPVPANSSEKSYGPPQSASNLTSQPKPVPVNSSASLDDLLTSIEGKSPKAQVPVIPPNISLNSGENLGIDIGASANSNTTEALFFFPQEPIFSPDPHLQEGMREELRQAARYLQEQEELRQRELEAQRRERLQVKAKEAQDWLKNLDRLSSDGLWFEQFARQYPSELEAALDYLFS